jgi:hypothetical protein
MATIKLKARFDQLVTCEVKDDKGNVTEKTRTRHYTFGRGGAPISGGLYIKASTPIPDVVELLITEE